MIQAERDQSNARRDLIAAQNRASNRPRPNRVIPPADRADEMLARIGITVDDDRPVDWKALTASG
jgi:hypothetical protein